MTPPRLDRWGDELDDDVDDAAVDRDWTPPTVPDGPLLPATPERIARLRAAIRDRTDQETP